MRGDHGHPEKQKKKVPRKGSNRIPLLLGAQRRKGSNRIPLLLGAQTLPGPILRRGGKQRSTVPINSSHSFLIMWLRSIEMLNTIVNTVYDTIANLRYYSTHYI
jgi:hypothetical protein